MSLRDAGFGNGMPGAHARWEEAELLPEKVWIPIRAILRNSRDHGNCMAGGRARAFSIFSMGMSAIHSLLRLR